jgi:hypothetical protein
MTRVHVVLDLASDGSDARTSPEALAAMCAEYVPQGNLHVIGHSISVEYDVRLDAYADTIEFDAELAK